jgi:hypothetical protein
MISDEELQLLLEEEDEYINDWKDSLTEEQINTI